MRTAGLGNELTLKGTSAQRQKRPQSLLRVSSFLFFFPVLDEEIEDDWISERKQQKGGALGVSLSPKRGRGIGFGCEENSRVKRCNSA